jgi:aromatic-L-amino-acid decarboxylase
LNATLFPPPAVRQAIEQRLAAALEAADLRVRHGKVTPDFEHEAFAAELARVDFDRPQPLEALCDWAIAQLEHGVVHMTHPRYLGLFNPAPSFAAQCADQIVASFNPQLATATTSPAAVAMEAHVIRAVAARAGLPAGGGGHFTSGGSEANGTALVCALTRAEPRFASAGSRAFAGPPVFYISKDSHLAWIKLAHMAGIGRSAARLVATDGAGRMDLEALAGQIASDRADGCVPVMVVATAGTTNAGAIDPLVGCRDLAVAEGAWFHVDAAWGGGLIASGRLRALLQGMDGADSVTIDAHKWFATTMGCGMLLVADPANLAVTYDVRTSFMPSHEPAHDPYLTTAQWSRRFVGLRLFMSLGSAGWSGHAAHVERAVALAARLANGMAERGWSVVNAPALAVVCLRPPPGSAAVHVIVAKVLESGAAWVSAAQFGGEPVIRACITHGETSDADIDAVLELLDRCRLG